MMESSSEWRPTDLELRLLAVLGAATWEQRAELLGLWRAGRLRELAACVEAHERGGDDGAG
ncbi:MAG: hypothetical protein WCK28_00705 [Burkholderiales bacterium]|jgi:hypothetical protein